jgi:glycosyltransferase involved in cell wall biosynthesis
LSKALPNAARVYDSHTSVYFEHGHFGASESGQKVTFERERNAIKEADHVITVSKETKEYLMRTYKADNESITIVKNATQLNPIDRPVHPANQRFTCSIILPIDGFESNSMALKMLLSVAQETEKTDPEIRFVVIGGGDKPDPKSQNVYYTGFVPDLGAEILKSDVCLNTYPKDAVCGGTRNKVCDYLVLGQPIISTKEGMRGFDDCVPGEDYILANDVKATVSKILELKNNPDRLIKLRFKALTKGIDYQWSKKAKEVLKVFDSL